MKYSFFRNQLLQGYALRYEILIVLTIILEFCSILFQIATTVLFAPVVLSFFGQDVTTELAAQPIIQNVVSIFDSVPPDNRLLVMGGIFLLALTLEAVTTYMAALVSSYLSYLLAKRIHLEAIQLVLNVDFGFFVQWRVGDLIDRFQHVQNTAQVIPLVINIIILPVAICIYSVMLLSISIPLTLVSAFLLFLSLSTIQFFIGRSKTWKRHLADLSKTYSNTLLEVLYGIRLVKTASNEDLEYQRLKNLIEVREKAEFQFKKDSAAIAPIKIVTVIALLLAFILCGRIWFPYTEALLPLIWLILLTYSFIVLRLLLVLKKFRKTWSEYFEADSVAYTVEDLLHRRNKPFMQNGKITYGKMTEGIRFEEVSFSYPGQEGLVLNQINLWIPKGSTLALVGWHASGKSTLVDLIPRFYEPVEGRITIDGKDLRDYDLRSLRKAIGIVSQDTFFFNTSARNNIAYGVENATDEEIIAAAQRANAYDFIQKLPEGFDTIIGDRGIYLSWGQKQRIAIARAMVRDPDIVILDEATAGLDTVTERLVQEAIDELCRDRTTIVIAHRLSTVQNADQIAVMDRGRIVQIGTHEELLEQGGRYACMYTEQYHPRFC